MELHHLAVVVEDLGRAERFYCGVLGLSVLRRWEDERGEHRSTWISLGGGAFLAIERAARGGPKRSDEAPGLHCVALRIPKSERESWRARVEVERESPYTLYFRDPDGNLIALSHYPD